MSDHIFYANKSVKLFVRSDVFSLLIEDLFKCLKRSLSLDIYLTDEILDGIEKTPFLITRIYRLREEGASIYRFSAFTEDIDILCQVDFKKTLEVRGIKGESSHALISDGDRQFTICKEQFDQIQIQEYRLETDDINISFYADSANVIKNSSTRVHWNVRNATRVEIDGIGEVSAAGSRTITFLNDTIINIVAFNRKQKKIKSLCIRTANQLIIDYDIQYLNPASNQFHSLGESNHKGVYGIYKGHKIKLIWSVEHADEVMIKPFGCSGKGGEYIFSVKDTLEITIQAIMHGGMTKSTRIIIHEFPVHVFNQKLVKIDARFLPKVEFKVNDLRIQAYSYLKERGYLRFNEVTQRLRERTLSCERELSTLYNHQDFRSFYKTHSIPELKKNIKERLLSYFRDKPSILSIVNRMPDHHD